MITLLAWDEEHAQWIPLFNDLGTPFEHRTYCLMTRDAIDKPWRKYNTNFDPEWYNPQKALDDPSLTRLTNPSGEALSLMAHEYVCHSQECKPGTRTPREIEGVIEPSATFSTTPPPQPR